MSELTKALVAAQISMPDIQRDKINPAFKSHYLSLEKLLEEVLPVLNKHGLAVAQWPTYVIVGDEAKPALTTALIHGDTGETMEGTMLLLPAKSDPQGQGGAITYAKRYALMALCGLSADEDTDGNAPRTRRRASTATNSITDSQRTRLFAIARGRKLPTDQVKAIIVNVAGVESSNDIPKDKYEAVVAAIEVATVEQVTA